MARYTGQFMKIYWGTIDVSGFGRNLQVQLQGTDIDVTAYSDTEKSFLIGLAERQATLEVLDDSVNSLIRKALVPGSQTTGMSWMPIGTASGSPKFTAATAVVKENSIQYPYDGAVIMNVTFRFVGAVTEGVI